MNTEAYRVKPDENVKLDEIDPEDIDDFDGNKNEGKEELADLTTKLESLQETFYSAHKHGILIVLQGMDTSGKDGTVRHVFDGVNPAGVRVASFKAPTPLELSHDFLWRIHAQAPEKGEVVIFNRSHYEDVLIVRVHDLLPEEVWKKRYDHINNFEEMLTDEGTVILKFYLHISHKEQKERLLARLDTPEKQWKFNPEDLKERDYWKDYEKAYEAVLSKTSTKFAPWYIVPANHKWFRDLIIAQVLVDALKKLHPEPPKTMDKKEIAKYRKELEG